MSIRCIQKSAWTGVVYCLLAVASMSSFALAQDVAVPAVSGADALRSDAVEQARQGRYALALSMIQQAVKASADSAGPVYDQIVILAWSDEYAQAIKAYEDLDPKTPPPDYVIPEVARCYRFVKNYDKALSLYRQYLTRYPEDKNAIKGIIYTYLDAGDHDAAEKFIQDIVASEVAGRAKAASFIGDVYLARGDIDKAGEIYASVLKKDFDDVNALLGLSRVLMAKGLTQNASKIIDQVLKEDPKNFQGLVAQGEILEADEEYLKAYDHYGQMSQIYPRSPIVTGLRYRSLAELGATSLAKEKIAGLDADLDVKRNIVGDEAMARVRWGEPAAARDIIRTTRDAVDPASGRSLAYYQHPFIKRLYFDEIAALRQQDDAKLILWFYEMLKGMDIEVPAWTLTQVADSYLYLQQPEKALAVYREVLDKGWDPEGATRMAIYDTLIELGRYREADGQLVFLDKETPVQTIRRGVFMDNWTKEDIAMNKAWSLMYQDRLEEANDYLDCLLMRAPMNSHTRTALAHTYLWRGWPRKALEEFQVSQTLDPEAVSNQVGMAYALHENDRGEEARRLAEELRHEHPTNKHVERLSRAFEVQDKRTLTFDAVYEHEGSGFSGFMWSVRADQPIKPWRSLFAEYVYRQSDDDVQKVLRRRWRLGTDWRINRDIWFTGGVSFDQSGEDFGHFQTLSLTPDDHWMFSFGHDSYSLSIPHRAAVAGVTARDYSLLARYRASEFFTGEIYTTFRNYSDDNEQKTYGFRLDRALTTSAYWKTRIALEGSADFYSRNDVDYFSPEYLYTAYLVPMVEHTWFRRYERAWVDRLYVGLGYQWQKSFGTNNPWYVRYEQDHRLSDTLSILPGIVYAKRYYDGEDEDSLTVYLTVKYRF